MYVSIQFPFHSWKTMENQGLVRVFSFIFILKLPRSKQPLLLNSNHWLTLANIFLAKLSSFNTLRKTRLNHSHMSHDSPQRFTWLSGTNRRKIFTATMVDVRLSMIWCAENMTHHVPQKDAAWRKLLSPLGGVVWE